MVTPLYLIIESSNTITTTIRNHMSKQSVVDTLTDEPKYICDTCNTPIFTSDTQRLYTKDNLFFCSPGCVYVYYEGEPATQGEEYEP